MTNSEEPDEIPQIVFHQGLYYMLRQKRSSEKEKQFHLEKFTRDPSICSNGSFKVIVSNQKKESISK